MKKTFLIVLGLATVAFAACSPAATDTTEVAPSVIETQEPAEIQDDATTEREVSGQEIAQGEVRVIEMEAGAFYYKPDQIRVKKGETVRIVMNSVDMVHDLVIDELNIQIPITKSGEMNVVEFTADTVGEFEFYCSVGSHRAQGQVGTLIVEE